jgi:hypothetical protein
MDRKTKSAVVTGSSISPAGTAKGMARVCSCASGWPASLRHDDAEHPDGLLHESSEQSLQGDWSDVALMGSAPPSGNGPRAAAGCIAVTEATTITSMPASAFRNHRMAKL